MWPLAGLLRVRDDVATPEVCYSICNTAYLEAVSVGKSPALCQPNSHFLVYLQSCKDCLSDNSPPGVKFIPYLDYCGIAPAESQVSTSSQAGPITAASSSRPPPPSYTIPISWLTSTTLTLTTSLLDINNKSITTTLTPTVIYTRPDWTGFSTSTHTSTSPAAVSSTSPPASSPPDTNRAWIAGPVVGSVAGLVLIILTIAFFLRKSKQRRGGTLHTGEPELQGDSAYSEYKPPQQLHGDAANFHELDAAQQWEMPANEVAAREMAAREEGGWRPSGGEATEQNQAVYPGHDQTTHAGYDQGFHAGHDQTIYAVQDPLAVYSGHDEAAYQEHDQAASPGHNRHIYPAQDQSFT